jgi:hypothetical protein
MKIIFFLLIFLYADIFSQETDIFERWDRTDKLIWDKKIMKVNAVDSIKLYVEEAKKILRDKGLTYTDTDEWVFPMRGYTEIRYREGGKDYRAKFFDYFQGGDSKGHPAHDIFILDKDSNKLEDNTGKMIEALSPVNGVVFTTHTGWKVGDQLRSGNYIKIFDPETEAMFYYSHLDTVFLKAGDIVKAGDPVGYIGRTGRKAIHGKTHLHIAYYKIRNGYPKPVDIIDEIYEMEKRITGKK